MELRLDRLQQRYREILPEMEQLGLVNPALDIAAVGFRALSDKTGEQLGILLTPWFMNLLLLPREPTLWGETQRGTTCVRELPAGEFEFIFAWDQQCGGYAMCSLFSPMFQFADQESAEETATQALLALFAAPMAKSGSGESAEQPVSSVKSEDGEVSLGRRRFFTLGRSRAS